MEFKLTPANIAEVEADAAIGFIPQVSSDSKLGEGRWNRLTGGLVDEMVSRKEIRPKHRSTAVIHRPQGLKAGRLLLVSPGKPGDSAAEALQLAAGTAWRKLRTAGVQTLAVEVPDGDSPEQSIRAIAEGIYAADYESDTHKSANRKQSSLENVVLAIPEIVDDPDLAKSAQQGLDRAMAISYGRLQARKLVNEPANLLGPRELARRAKVLTEKAGLACEILDKDRLAELRMGALLGVAQGSVEPPVMIVVRYSPPAPEQGAVPDQHLGLVGKAVTFDTGGISIKPSKGMHLMKGDMGGGAAVIGAMLAIARLRPAIPVTGVVPSVENMPGGRAQRPGDVVTSRSGKTIEVLNTDAEGRLILADALTYAQELGCTHLVDLATLTGAIMVALGEEITGLFGNDDEWRRKVEEAGKSACEPIWPMPAGPKYSKLLKSPIADLANIGPRWGGACTAAAFLGHFAEDVPWAHLDIAGTAWYEKEQPHAAAGPSGTPVGTLADLAMAIERD